MAIAEKRLPAMTVLDRLVIDERDAAAYEPTRYKNRAGAKGRGSRPKGTKMSDEARARISQTQARRWAQRKANKA